MLKTKSQAEKDARQIVNKWAAGATAGSWVPGSTFFLSAADYMMIRKVAHAYGVDNYDQEAACAAVAGSFVGKSLVELLSFIPGPGWIAKAFIAGGITKAMGDATISYFGGLTPYK